MRPFLVKYSRRLAQVLGSPTPWIFLIGAVAVGLLVEGFSKLIDVSVVQQPLQPALTTIGLGLLLLLLLIIFFNLPQTMERVSQMFRPPGQTTLVVEEPVPHRRGLIALVSFGQYTPAADALYYHGWSHEVGIEPTLTHCWLLAGPGEGEVSSAANALQLANLYRAKGIEVEIWQLEDADSIEEVFRVVKTIYLVAEQKYRLPKEEIIADYTGGTKSMTAGMVLAALEWGVALQYMKPNAYLADGRADRPAGSRPRQVLVDFVSVVEH